MKNRFLTLFVLMAFIGGLFVLVGCEKNRNPQPSESIVGQAPMRDATSAFPRVRLMTQDENFNLLLKCGAGTCGDMQDRLVQYSASWQQASKEANATAMGFADPTLKAQAWQNKFAEVKNKFGGDEKFQEEGVAAVKSQLTKYVQEHSSDLFELARFDKYVANGEYLTLTHLSIPFPSDTVRISLAEMDGALKRFRVVEADSIEKTFIGLRKQQPAVMRAFEEQGLRATPPSDEEERSVAAGIVLSERVSLAAKGDPVKPRIDELYLVDVPSGVVLAQLSTGSAKKSEPKDIALAGNSEEAPPSDAEPSIREALDNWVQTFRNKDARMHGECYAPMIERYFLRSNITHDQLRRDKEQAFQHIAEIRQYEIHDLAITPVTGGGYSATFRKLWDTTGTDGKQFSGEDIQRLQFEMFNGEWKIVSETEPKVIHVIKGNIRR